MGKRPRGTKVRESTPVIAGWTNRAGGERSYHLTQFLTGHGNFQNYLYKIGKAASAECTLCGGYLNDSPWHTLVQCKAFDDIRNKADENLRAAIRKGMSRFVQQICLLETNGQAGKTLKRDVLVAKDQLGRCASPQGTTYFQSLYIRLNRGTTSAPTA